MHDMNIIAMANASPERHKPAMAWKPPLEPNVAANRIREHRRRRDLSQDALATLLGVTATTISNLEHGKIQLTEQWMRRLGDALEVAPSELTMDGLAAPAATWRAPLPGQGSPARRGADVPGGRAADGHGPTVGQDALPLFAAAPDPDGNRTVTVDWSRPVEQVRRPPGLAGAGSAYCLYMHGDAMQPRFVHGERVYVSPDRPAREGDDVVVLVRDIAGPPRKGDPDPATAYIRRLTDRTADGLTLAQFNPAIDIIVPADRVAAIHRIYPTAELLGL